MFKNLLQLGVNMKKILSAIEKISIAILLLIVLFSIRANAQDPKTYIPSRAFQYQDQLYDEIKNLFPELPEYNYVGSLIEHESCISLKHSRCWTPSSELSNKREYSVGFFQIAKAYNPDGSTRMDTLASLKKKYKDSLSEATWDNLKFRPDLQFRAGLHLIKENYDRFYTVDDPIERLAFTDASYNGGYGWVSKERRQCSLTRNCNPDRWFDNTENQCLRGKKKIAAYGNRSICDIAKAHPRDTLLNRLPKYQKQYFTPEYIKQRDKGKKVWKD